MKALFIFTAVHVFVLVATAPTNKVNEDLTWYCKTICDGCHGESNYDVEKSECTCKINENISDDDMALIKRISGTIGMKFKIVDTSKIRRETDDNESEENDVSETTSEVPEKSTKLARIPLHIKLRSRFLQIANETDPLLGQMHHPNILDTNLHHNTLGHLDAHHNGVLGPHLLPYHHNSLDIHRNALVPTAGEALKPALTRAMLTNVRNRLNNLIERNDKLPYDHRRTALEAESLRTALKQITHVNGNARSDAASNPFWKTSLFNGALPGFGGLLGQAAPSTDSTEISEEAESQEHNGEEDIKDGEETRNKTKIITQPKNLIENSEEDGSE